MLFSSSSRLLAFTWFVGFASVVAARLPPQELESLSAVARSLGKMDWPFGGGDVDPCNGQPPWFIKDEDNAVKCSCENNATTICHVTHIFLKSSDLSGSLPPELVGLPSLEVIDLSRNYLNGTIPPQWGSMPNLKIISLLGNRLTGPIPEEIANITTLEQLVLEANQLNGTIPWEFGNLTRIERLLLSSNNLTGELPASLANLTSLRDFRISDNNFTGSIPNYIQNWTNLTRLEIQASGLAGPIPSNLASLTKLNDLRISDLNGIQSDFPNLNTSTSWDKVILRSCIIVGQLPEFIGQLEVNDSLDVSFNKLTGAIPQNLGTQKGDIYLTGNSLTGPVPESMKYKDIDLSYNNFTSLSPEPGCAFNSPNLFANSKGNTSGTFYCVSSNCKPDDFYYFYINCGSARKVDDYEADGPVEAKFFQSSTSNWGFSSTGQFWNTKDYGKSLVHSSENLSVSRLESKLYRDARLSPLSLTYYGFCLRNGNYTVNLHFAEIMFTNDTTYRSLGRRIFDIYIQGNLVEKDFNIVNRAGGVNMPIKIPYPAVVNDHTLEISFYWAGKGTNSLPQRSVYSPLISAISVVHNDYKLGKDISTGAIVGIVMAVLFAVILVVGIMWWKGCLERKDSMHHDLKGLDLHTGSYTQANQSCHKQF